MTNQFFVNDLIHSACGPRGSFVDCVAAVCHWKGGEESGELTNAGRTLAAAEETALVRQIIAVRHIRSILRGEPPPPMKMHGSKDPTIRRIERANNFINENPLTCISFTPPPILVWRPTVKRRFRVLRGGPRAMTMTPPHIFYPQPNYSPQSLTDNSAWSKAKPWLLVGGILVLTAAGSVLAAGAGGAAGRLATGALVFSPIK